MVGFYEEMADFAAMSDWRSERPAAHASKSRGVTRSSRAAELPELPRLKRRAEDNRGQRVV